MPVLRTLFFLCVASFLPVMSVAQSDEGTRLERLIETTLSDEGRIIDVTGFRGALSSRAQFDRLTIADDTGIWLTMNDAVLDWDFGALLRGTLEIKELSAASIDVARQPVPPSLDLPPAQASGFSIPDLPVSVRIDSLSVPAITLGASLLGEPMTLALQAMARLDSAGAEIDVTASRTDGSEGAFLLKSAFDPVTTELLIEADLTEAQGGLVSRILSIPRTPAIGLRIRGSGPLDNFIADLALNSAEEERVSGRLTLRASDNGSRVFTADVGGDVRPLLPPGTHDFFGAEVRLRADGLVGNDGAFQIQSVNLASDQMQFTGKAMLSANGTPGLVAMKGLVSGEDRVAIPGTDVTLQMAELEIDFDAARSPDWAVQADATGLQTTVANLERVFLTATGQFTPEADDILRGAIRFEATGVKPYDPGLAQASGDRISARSTLVANADGRVSLSDLTLTTQHATLSGSAVAVPLGRQLGVSLELKASAPDLTPFAGVAAPWQGGKIEAAVTADALFPSGTFTGTLSGSGSALDIGQPKLVPLLAPETKLELSVRRDATGTFLDTFSLQNPLLEISGEAMVSSDAAAFDLDGTLTEISALVPGLAGAVTVRMNGKSQSDLRRMNAEYSAVAQFGTFSGTAMVVPDKNEVTFDASLNVPGIADFGRLTAPLQAGTLAGRVTGRYDTESQSIRADLSSSISRLDIGQPRLSPLLQPDTTLKAAIFWSAPSLTVEMITLQNPVLTASGSGALAGENIEFEINARLADLALLEPGVSGPLELDMTATGTSDLKNATALFNTTAEFGTTSGVARLSDSSKGRKLNITADVNAGNLAAFSRIGAPLRGGAAQASVSLDIEPGTQTLTASVQGSTRNLDIGISALAPLLRPRTRWQAKARQTPEGIFVDSLSLNSAALSAEGSATLAGTRNEAELSARLNNLGQIVASLPGAVTLKASGTNLLKQPQIAAQIEGANGISADVSGRVGLPGGTVDLTAKGSAPLGLAQPMLSGQTLRGQATYTLSLTGKPELSALAGTVTVLQGRFSDPELGLVLSPLAADVRLEAGRAFLTMQANANGGSLRADGSMAMTAPFATDLSLTIGALPLRYRDILRTKVNGQIGLSGPATQRLAINGAVQLAETEIRVPDTGLGTIDPVPLIRHIGAPGAVRQTLDRANLPQDAGGAQAGSGTRLRLPLSLSVTLDDPIFVRGRGLDAEFQGALRIEGSVSDPIPVGQFTLRRGRLSFLGKRLDLTEGSITAAGSLIPRVRIIAEASTPDVTARIALQGLADKPDLSLSSVPELPEDEILSLLLFGQSASSLSPFQIARLISSLSQLSGRGGSGFLDTTRARLGFDDLDIRADSDTGEVELAIGKYVSDNVYSEVALGAQGQAQINLNLDVSKNTRLRGSVNSGGETGVGLFWQKDY